MTRKPFFINPPNTLKIKVGDGGIPAYVIKRCQDFIENNSVDFIPYGFRNLEQLRLLKDKITDKSISPFDARIKLTNVVMQLKSNGSMFQYQLISMVSDVMLDFLEKSQEINDDFIDILNIYVKILEIVFNKRLTGNGGNEGYALTQELHNACQRYLVKYAPGP